MVARTGRTSPYRNMVALGIPEDFEIPTCDQCGTEWIDEDTAQALDRILDIEYRRILRERAQQAISVLAQHITQRRLETLLGISKGYLSRLRSGDKDPSPELVSNLTLLACDPLHRIAELEALWGNTSMG